MTPVEQSPGLVHQLSSSDEKIAFFRSLFRGRQDVYPRRFESRKTGKSGYAPLRARESIGYTIVLPASAIPGWPADVALPADPLGNRSPVRRFASRR